MIISKITPKIMNLPAFVRRSREGHGVPHNEGTGTRFVPEGKCYDFTANRFTFPPQEYNIALANAFLKFPGATANCRTYTKPCKSTHPEDIS